MNDVRRLRVTLHPATKSAIAANRATWKNNVINAFEKKEDGAFLKDSDIQDIFEVFKNDTGGTGLTINDEAVFKAYLQNNDEWFDEIFNSYFN